ncbi:MAG TPA: DegT/DnrJ/EryC1/StrS family aminotransferase [Vicinamibacterales bacterium]|nr:DegT/DnrJ/EryC1/StrS family aminotransferase [Vicinamibacterales bacterium]
MKPIHMSSPDITEDDIAAVVDVLRSGRLALGPQSEEFERLIAEYVGVRHAIAVSSGTAALHMIVRALGFGRGDEVLVPSFTFAASVNALLFEGVTPVFVDIERDTFNLDPDDVERKITPRTKAIMAVDVFGHPAEWDRLDAIARAHRLRIIDDSCEALGAEYRGRRVGQFGDAGAFAFYPNKQLTTGEGGVVVTNDGEIARACRSLRNQGRPEMGAWLEHERLGYNYRLDEMSCALGCSQMRRIETLLAKRERVAAQYTDRLRRLEWISAPAVRPHVRASWFVYVVTVSGIDRGDVIDSLAAAGIPARAYFSPVHLQSYIRALMPGPVPQLPVTDAVARRAVALPFHGNLTDEEIERVVDALSKLPVGI